MSNTKLVAAVKLLGYITCSSLDKLKPEKLFFILALIFGLAFTFITPPYMAPDENRHFFRAYSISEGKLFASTASLPNNLWWPHVITGDLRSHPERKIKPSDLLGIWNIPLQPDYKISMVFTATSSYGLVAYGPQTAGILLGRLLGFNPLPLTYLARLFNLLFWIFLITAAIRIAPTLKWVLLLLALTPMGLFQAASVSADAMTNGFSFFTIASLLYLAKGAVETIRAKQMVFLTVLLILLAMTKLPYILLALLYFLIPPRKFSTTKRYLIFTLVLFILLAAVSAIGPLSSRFDPDSLRSQNTQTNSGMQIDLIIKHPFNFLRVVIRSFGLYFGDLFLTYIGRLGWLDTVLPLFIYITYPILALFSVLVDHEEGIKFKLWERLLSAVIPGLIYFFIAAIMYIFFLHYKTPTIEGIQGRYFIPAVPLLALLFYNQRIHLPRWVIGIIILVGICIILTTTTFTLVGRYYTL